jgi:predicted MFS family arabinose efflux permease
VAPVPTVLRIPDFRRFWLASLASNCGSWLQVVAAGWLVLQQTGSPAAVGALALVARGPAFLLSTFGGQLADRFDRRRVGVWTFALQGASAAAMAVLSATGHLGTEVIFALTFALGIGFALGLPAMLALVPALVPAGRLSQAVSLNAAGINVARLAGPAAGGLLLDLLGATWCFGLNALSFVALIAVLTAVRPREHGTGGAGVRMRAALGVAARDPAIRRLLVGMAVFSAFAAPVQELAPVVAETLDAGAVGLGLLLGAMGGGALVGAWLLERLQGRGLPRSTALPVATVVFGAFMAALAAAPAFAPAAVAMAACGTVWIWMFIATNTSVQLRAPLSMVGRMLGLYQLAVVGPIALGSVLAGALADVAGIRVSLAGCAAVLLAWGAWSLANRVPQIDAGRAPEPGGAPAR